MIKINLLGVAPPPTRTSPAGPPAAKATQVIIFVGALIICFGLVWVFYMVWSSQIKDLEKARAKEVSRQQELAVIKAKNLQYQKYLKDLETRINTIQALQNSRTGPVELMTALGNIVSRTNDVYLYSLTPNGDALTLKGQSGTVDSMANFLSYLKRSGSFDEVHLDQFYQDDQHERVTYKFAVSCQFKSPTGGVSPTSGAAPVMASGPASGGPQTGPSGRPELQTGGGPQGLPGQVQQHLIR
jgi:Tfp pilus assembly protein PilN